MVSFILAHCLGSGPLGLLLSRRVQIPGFASAVPCIELPNGVRVPVDDPIGHFAISDFDAMAARHLGLLGGLPPGGTYNFFELITQTLEGPW